MHQPLSTCISWKKSAETQSWKHMCEIWIDFYKNAHKSSRPGFLYASKREGLSEWHKIKGIFKRILPWYFFMTYHMDQNLLKQTIFLCCVSLERHSQHCWWHPACSQSHIFLLLGTTIIYFFDLKYVFLLARTRAGFWLENIRSSSQARFLSSNHDWWPTRYTEFQVKLASV